MPEGAVPGRKYSDVEDLVFKGFLTTKMQIGETTLVVKSLNLQELKSLLDRLPLRGTPTYNDLFETWVIAYSLYMVDGENVLMNRPRNLSELLDLMLEVPSNIRSEILGEVLILQKAQDVELKRLEPYSYEPQSRHTWLSYRGKVLCDSMLTGIAGTQLLGLNSHQKAWVYLNTEEDNRLESEQQWSFAKFIASASNPKGVRRIDSKDKARLKRLDEEREKIRLGVEYKGPVKIERRSIEELRYQLEADIEGKQDLHDQIISAYEASMAERARKRREEQNRRLEDMRQERADEMDHLSDEELADRLSAGAGYFQVITEDELERRRADNTDRTLRWAKAQRDRRNKRSEDVMRDRREIAAELVDMVGSDGPPDSLTIPTTDKGPVGPIDTTPKPNPRIPTGDRKEEKYSGRVSDEGSIRSSGASNRLTRHTYGSPNQKRVMPKPVNPKHTSTRVRDIPGEEDFFAGSETTYGKSPKKDD